jgi:hypothetical protein
VQILRRSLGIGNGFKVPADDAERRAQFMGDVGNEVPAYPFQIVDAGDVASDQKLLALFSEGHDPYSENYGLVGRRGDLQRLLVVPIGEILFECRIVEPFGQRLADVRGPAQTEKLYTARVTPLDSRVAVHDDRSVRKHGGRLPEAINKPRQAALALAATGLQAVDQGEHVRPQAAGRQRRALAGLLKPVPQSDQVEEMCRDIRAQTQRQKYKAVTGEQRADDRHRGDDAQPE